MLKLKYYIIAVFCFAFAINAKATHNRAGEITYKWLYGYTYEIKVTTYTNIGSGGLADRCQDTVYFGDGSPPGVVNRSNGTNTLCSFPAKDGVPLSTTIKLNEYITTHTYPGPGNYKISMTDPNRNAGVINLPNSVNQVFYIESFLVISTFMGPNNSAVLTFPPIDKGCLGKCFIHNPGAADPDGDSLSYELTYCRGTGGQAITGYTYPATGGGTYDVNALNGNLTWCTPQLQGEYNLAMIIREWRKNPNGDYVQVGYILRDLQVDVGTCINNQPNINVITDTCIVAGSILTKTITVTDPDPDIITLSANGGPFIVTPSATFSAPSGSSPVSGLFSWQTTCAHIRKSPYQVTIKAEDNDPQIHLVDFKTFNIRVIAPPPTNVIATPLGTSVKITWNASVCSSTTTTNKILSYAIYRKADCSPWVHANCETGVPASSGYTKVGSVSSSGVLQFIDNNAGNGLSQGTNYSYLVVAVYTDGAESYASDSTPSTCVQLKRDVPILINVDVTTTDLTNGSIDIRWIKPVLGVNALDTIAVPGPYEFRLTHFEGFANANSTYTNVFSATSQYFAGFNALSDTTYSHIGISTNTLNTQTIPHTYKIEFYANGQFVGSGQKASSVFLSLIPGDNTMTLNWTQQVPWINYRTRIFRKNPSAVSFVLIDSTTTQTYVDDSLTNGVLYCYYVETIGQYSDPTIYSPLENKSEEVCDKPRDTTPPCAPKLEIVSDCILPSLLLQWNNPNHSCSDDAVKYNIYISETEDSELILSDSIKIMNDTILAFDDLTSIAGCYAITAVDSFGNESAQSEKICVDNCPEYELPNVITVNGDGVNDFFKPIKNKFIKDIDLKIYNRWGMLVFETTDPAINWDGKTIQSKLLSTEGTYFYVCQVNEIRVTGIKERYLKGFLQIFHK